MTAAPTRVWEARLQKATLIIARLTLAYLFFTQLWWKVPPGFGCPDDFAFTTGSASGNRLQLQRTSGLCDWIGIESVWSQQPRPILVSNLDNRGDPEIAIDIGFIARLNGAFIDGFVKPNIQWFGYIVWGMEAFIFLSLFSGLFSRLGGLVALVQGAQLTLGLAGIGNPVEWEWSYNWLAPLAVVMIAFAPGRYLGLDTLIRPRLLAAAEKGNRVARAVAWLT
jgi:hypothetical protein